MVSVQAGRSQGDYPGPRLLDQSLLFRRHAGVVSQDEGRLTGKAAVLALRIKAANVCTILAQADKFHIQQIGQHFRQAAGPHKDAGGAGISFREKLGAVWLSCIFFLKSRRE